MSAVQELNKRLARLPEQERESLAAALLETLEAQTSPGYEPFPVKKRIPGLGKGTVALAPDFDDPLPDAFWLGEG